MTQEAELLMQSSPPQVLSYSDGSPFHLLEIFGLLDCVPFFHPLSKHKCKV